MMRAAASLSRDAAQRRAASALDPAVAAPACSTSVSGCTEADAQHRTRKPTRQAPHRHQRYVDHSELHAHGVRPASSRTRARLRRRRHPAAPRWRSPHRPRQLEHVGETSDRGNARQRQSVDSSSLAAWKSPPAAAPEGKKNYHSSRRQTRCCSSNTPSSVTPALRSWTTTSRLDRAGDCAPPHAGLLTAPVAI